MQSSRQGGEVQKYAESCYSTASSESTLSYVFVSHSGRLFAIVETLRVIRNRGPTVVSISPTEHVTFPVEESRGTQFRVPSFRKRKVAFWNSGSRRKYDEAFLRWIENENRQW